MKNDTINKLLMDEDKNLQKLHKIVKEAIDAEELIIHNLSNPETEALNFGQKISDKVALFWRKLEIHNYVFYCVNTMDNF